MSSTYWQTQYQSARRKVQELETERDALAAHVERLTRKIGELIASNRVDGRDFHHILKDTPTTSLARRDARMKAEALDDAADVIDRVGADYPQGFLRGRAAKIRQQAEGGGDE